MKKLVFVSIIVVVLGAYWFFQAAPEPMTGNVFTNARLGLSFSYPESYGTVEVTFAEPGRRPGGETGIKLSGTFSAFPSLEFGGITKDFTAGREGMLTDTRGFSYRDGKYYFQFVETKPVIEVQPLKVLEGAFGEIVILDEQSFEGERLGLEGPVMGVGKGRLAALVNLKGTEFAGIVFSNWDIELLPLEEFEVILRSIEVFVP